MTEKKEKTPLDVMKDWNPSKEFCDAVEAAYKRRNRFRLKRVKL